MCEQEIIPSSIVKVFIAVHCFYKQLLKFCFCKVENPEELLHKAAKRDAAASEAD